MGSKTTSWKMCSIGEFAELVMGQSPPGSTYNESGEGLPFFQGSRDFGLRYPERRVFCTEPTRLAEPGDVLISVRAPIGAVNRATERCAIGRGVAALRGATPRDTTYLEYVLRNQGALWRARESEGTVFGNLRKRDLLNLTFSCPPESLRGMIGETLGSLDDKIDTNQGICSTLQAIAETVFQALFVDFLPIRRPADEWAGFPSFPATLQETNLGKIPSGWGVGTALEEYNVVLGQSPPGESYNETGDGTVFFQGSADFAFRYPRPRVYCTDPKRFAEPGDTLMSVRAPVGDINLADQRCVIGRGLWALRHQTGSRSYTYYSLRALKERLDVYQSDGTLFGSLSKKKFRSLYVLSPPRELVAAFERFAAPIDELIEVLSAQAVELAALRDTLMPPLLDGRCEFSEAGRKARGS